MCLSTKEFGKRVKDICDRWYLKTRSLTIISKDGAKTYENPVQVWEHPFAKGLGFETDSMVMEIEGLISLSHLKKLKEGHWYRTQEMQKSIFLNSREQHEEREKRVSKKTAYETKQYVLEHRGAFRETARRLGLSRGSIRDGLGV